MASTDSSPSSDDTNLSTYHIAPYSSPNKSQIARNLQPDPSQPGPSSVGRPSCSSWSPQSERPFTPRKNRTAMVASEIDRTNTSSSSSDSSLGESRSPDVIWRDDSPERACGGNIPTRMFSNTSRQRKRAYSDDFHYSKHAKLMHKYDSCVSDMSEFSPDSANCSTQTSLKDESNGSGLNGHSSSGMNSDQEKQEKISQATFDKVLIDANQRRHIRNKARNTGTDSGSDSSSGNMCLDMTMTSHMTDVVGTSQKLDSTTSESSGIGANYMSSVQCDFQLPRSTIMAGGVTNSSTGVSTMYNSQGNKVSDESKQESMSSGSSGARKRHVPWSIARYYYQTKRPPLSQDVSVDGDEGNIEMNNLPSRRIGQPERKRKRFHRTFTALRQCGLLDLTMQTASLMEQNSKLQKQLGELHRQAHLMYHTVSHFSKIQPNVLGSPETQKVMDGLKAMMDRNPVEDIDMSLFESLSGSRDSPAVESGTFTMSNQIPSVSVESSERSGALRIPGHQGPRNSSDSAIQSSINASTFSPSEKSGQ
ncbi:uncharacterized protein LOC135154787 isoform X1 [Lytechinus pictus]|uniref:uncharacterized protein LOC135154787 isoform X1 n=1 Tax=Lytechinus pictus TaxID=7653 RepID=UPI0030BA0414